MLAPTIDAALITPEFWVACSRWRCGTWLDRGESPANIADGPNRNAFPLMGKLKPRKVQSADYDKEVFSRSCGHERDAIRGTQRALAHALRFPRPPSPKVLGVMRRA